MRCYKLDKAAFEFTGEPESLLKGITSNMLDAGKNAFLTAKGKIIVTCDQKQFGRERIVVLMERYGREDFCKFIKLYLPLSKATMRELPGEAVYDLEGRVVESKELICFGQKQGQIVFGGAFENSVSDEEFTGFRLENHVPVHGVDYHDEMLLNVNDEDYVSYTKGCFVGQEVIARVHNLSKPPRKLVVRWEDECTDEQRERMTSKVTRGPLFDGAHRSMAHPTKIVDSATGRVRGFVFVPNK